MTPSFLQPGATCRRSRLPAWLRLVITFAVLFALKYSLPLLGIPAAVQIGILLVTVTAFAWFFWWNCTPDRRGVAVLLVTVWAAGIIKILRL
jgi:hypothetical protein